VCAEKCFVTWDRKHLNFVCYDPLPPPLPKCFLTTSNQNNKVFSGFFEFKKYIKGGKQLKRNCELMKKVK